MSDTPFPTEIVESRPIRTNNRNRIRPVEPTTSPYEKLREIKEKARSAQKTFLEQMTSHHKVQKALEEVTKKSLIKRIEFLKIYGNKKSKYQHRQLLDMKRRDDERFERKSMDLVKRRKLENELHQILLQNEQQEHICKLQSQNKQNKQVSLPQDKVTKKKLELTNLKQQSLRQHDVVRKGNTEFLIRKKNIQTSISMRSKHNYFQKVNHQLTMIKQYEDIMNEIQNFATFDEGKSDDSTLFQTIPKTNLITNNTISVI